jgi:hypothetical protein
LATPDRAVALSEQLIQVHQVLREQLQSLRREVTDGNGHGHPPEAAAIPADLLTHCLGFCAALHTHHTGEDAQLLPALRAAAPGLAPVIDNLMADHALVAGLLVQLRELLAGDTAGGPAEPARLLRELDGLIAILESHFGYEERRIAAALDTLGPGARIRSSSWLAGRDAGGRHGVLRPRDLLAPGHHVLAGRASLVRPRAGLGLRLQP